jgi:hypothetical protein
MAEQLNEDKLVVPADKDTAKKKVSVELEVDTSVKDLGPNPFAWVIHLARGRGCLEDIPKDIHHHLHIPLVQSGRVVHGTSQSNDGTVRSGINSGWCWGGLVRTLHGIKSEISQIITST